MESRITAKITLSIEQIGELLKKYVGRQKKQAARLSALERHTLGESKTPGSERQSRSHSFRVSRSIPSFGRESSCKRRKQSAERSTRHSADRTERTEQLSSLRETKGNLTARLSPYLRNTRQRGKRTKALKRRATPAREPRDAQPFL